MKHINRTQASAYSLIAIGMALSNTSASAALASLYIGTDSRPTQISGTYTGLANPNAGRLTFLVAHYDENDPLYPHHYHSKGSYVYTGANLGAATAVIVSTSNFLPEASGGTHLKLATSTSGAYAGKTAILEDTNNHFSLLQTYDTGKLDTAIPLENTLFTSSANRWSGSIAGANVNMVLTFATPGLNFGTASDPTANPFAGPNGKVLGDDVNFKWVPWVDSSTAENTPFIARFKLVDDRSAPNKFGDSGEFEYRFQTIPEPSSALLALFGGMFLFCRKR
jgi:hypothetical protein